MTYRMGILVCYFMIYYKNWLFFMQISRFVYLKTKLKLVLCQKIRSIIHRIGVQSFILLSQSAQYFCLTAILYKSYDNNNNYYYYTAIIIIIIMICLQQNIATAYTQCHVQPALDYKSNVLLIVITLQSITKLDHMMLRWEITLPSSSLILSVIHM